MNVLGSVEAVVAAIREDARDEVERLDRDADAAVARLRQDDAVVPIAAADADARIGAAQRRARERIAEQDWADRRAALDARDAWVAGVVAAGLRRLGDQPPGVRRSDLLRLAREAVARLGGADCDVLVTEADLPLIDDAWRLDAQVAAVKTDADSTAAAGGCIAQTRDGRIRFDNTYAARVRRFEALWRAALSELFDRAGAVHA